MSQAALVVCALLFALPSWALKPPKLEGRINDQAALLSSGEAKSLEKKLEAHEKATGQQFALLTVKSLEGDVIEDFAVRVFEAWKLGKKGKDDGLLLVVALEDRKMKIEVGYGLEGVITDAVASRVIRGTLTPAFKSQKYGAGIERAFDALMARAGGDPSAEPQPVQETRPDPRFGQWFGFIVLFLLIPFLHFASRRTGFGGRRGPFGGGFYGGGVGGFGSGYRGGGGFGGGGFGGGGGFSGGGGSSGGGGASGGW